MKLTCTIRKRKSMSMKEKVLSRAQRRLHPVIELRLRTERISILISQPRMIKMFLIFMAHGKPVSFQVRTQGHQAWLGKWKAAK